MLYIRPVFEADVVSAWKTLLPAAAEDESERERDGDWLCETGNESDFPPVLAALGIREDRALAGENDGRDDDVPTSNKLRNLFCFHQLTSF